MRVEVSHHDGQVISLGKGHRQQVFKARGPVDCRASIRDFHMAPPFQRSQPQQLMTHTLAFICIIVALGLAGFGWQRLTGVADLLFARLIHTKTRVLRRIRALIDIKHLFHAPAPCGIGLGRETPWLFQPRCKFGFVKC